MKSGASRWAVWAVLLVLPAGPASALDSSDSGAVASFEQQVTDSKVQLHLLQVLVEQNDITALERAKQLFNEAETEFLLENYDGCAAGLLEAVNVTPFRAEPNYPLALYYLGESLFRTESYIEAKHFLRQAASVMTPGKDSHYQDAIVRLIRLSELTGDSQGVDEYYQAAQQAGILRSEVIYLYAKWTANRRDLPLETRVARADAGFARIQPNQSFYPQATYFRGALKVEVEQYDEAIRFFETVTRLPEQKKDSKLDRLRNLATLAVARVLVEQGKLNEAVERYHSLPVGAEDYVEALFERAEALVRLGNIEEALRTSEILMVMGKDTPVAPDAQVLHANLLLKLGASNHENYASASTAFSGIVQTYRPVRDEVQAVVDQPDPVKHFDELLKRDPGTDVSKLLPKAAQGFADSTLDVKVATGIQHELATAKQDTASSDTLAKKLLDILSRGGLDMFPQLREANGRAVQMSNALGRMESDLVRFQVKLLGDNLPPDVKSQLDRLEVDRAKLDRSFQQLPKNQEEYDLRVQKFRKRIADLERKLFEAQRQLDTQTAIFNGLDKYWRDNLAKGTLDSEKLHEGETDLQQWRTLLDQLAAQRVSIEKQIAEEKLNLVAVANGGKEEEALRTQYHQQLMEMQAILTRVRGVVRPEDRPLLERLGQVRDEIDRQQALLTKLRLELRSRADDRAGDFRQKIVAEQVKIGVYQGSEDEFGPQAGQLFGQIAVESFRRVARQFYGIVLRGDVGIIDVAWTRKQEHTDQISKFGKEREGALKLLQDRFKEVLNDAE